MPKPLEIVERSYTNYTIEVPDEIWDDIQSEELYLCNWNSEYAYFTDESDTKHITVRVTDHWTEEADCGRSGLYDPEEGVYV